MRHVNVDGRDQPEDDLSGFYQPWKILGFTPQSDKKATFLAMFYLNTSLISAATCLVGQLF
jgi:hypothetical protein